MTMTTSSGLVNNSDFVIAIEVGADVIVRPAVYLSSRTHTGTRNGPRLFGGFPSLAHTLKTCCLWPLRPRFPLAMAQSSSTNII